jgi:hypothetical protein
MTVPLLSAILTALATLHLYWALGGSWGASAVVPRGSAGEKMIDPGPKASAMVAALLLFSAWIAVGRWWNPQWRSWMLAGIAVVFLVRAVGDFRYVGFFKSQKESLFAYWDTRLYSPLCVFLAALALLSR